MTKPGKVQLNLSDTQAERLRLLANLHGMCLSQMITYAINQWVFENYKDHLDKFA